MGPLFVGFREILVPSGREDQVIQRKKIIYKALKFLYESFIFGGGSGRNVAKTRAQCSKWVAEPRFATDG